MMSTRFTHREVDGDEGDKTSALEMAIDSHWWAGPQINAMISLSNIPGIVPSFCRLVRRKTVC